MSPLYCCHLLGNTKQFLRNTDPLWSAWCESNVSCDGICQIQFATQEAKTRFQPVILVPGWRFHFKYMWHNKQHCQSAGLLLRSKKCTAPYALHSKALRRKDTTLFVLMQMQDQFGYFDIFIYGGNTASHRAKQSLLKCMMGILIKIRCFQARDKQMMLAPTDLRTRHLDPQVAKQARVSAAWSLDPNPCSFLPTSSPTCLPIPFKALTFLITSCSVHFLLIYLAF